MACSPAPLLRYPLPSFTTNLAHHNNFLLKPTRISPLKHQSKCNTTLTNSQIPAHYERPKFKWMETKQERLTEAQNHAISRLPKRMEKRCKALMRQIICFTPEKGILSDLLAAWVDLMKPTRADWLSVLKELRFLDHPLLPQLILDLKILFKEGCELGMKNGGYPPILLGIGTSSSTVPTVEVEPLHIGAKFWEPPWNRFNNRQISRLVLFEETFEANVRDYTKMIHEYAKEERIEEAENLLSGMCSRGLTCDQITLTTLIHMYSKTGHFNLAKETFDEMKLLGQPLDRRSYGSMIMAYIRAGMPDKGEDLIKEMEDQEIYAGKEVYKALLRTYSMMGDAEGAQRVFDAVQVAGIAPDIKLCGLLINAYILAGESQKASIAFENMRKAGIEPDDKCIALLLSGYERENRLNTAMEFLTSLEIEGILVGKEASQTLVGWFRRLGVVEDVAHVLRECAENMAVS